jgi:acetyl esterase/lipase
MHVKTRAWLCATLIAVVGPAASAPAETAEHYAQRPKIRAVVPSPNGKRIAMIVTANTGRDALFVQDLPPTSPARIAAAYGKSDIERVFWVNDDRLVYEAYTPETAVGNDVFTTAAIDHDGANERRLQASNAADSHGRLATRVLEGTWRVEGSTHDGSGEVFVYETIRNAVGEPVDARLGRLDSRSGVLTVSSLGAPSGLRSWIYDAQGELRVVRTIERGQDRLHLRDPATGAWSVLQEVPLHDPRAIEPLYFERANSLVVRTHGGGDTSGLFSYDIRSRRLDPEPLLRVDRYDIGSPEFDFSERRMSGAHVVTDRPLSVWFSARVAAVQKAVDAALPADRFNTVYCGNCESNDHFVVRSTSPRLPGEYFIYDRVRRTLVRIGESRPWIAPATQGERDFHRVKTRDGTHVPLVVTHPPGRNPAEPLPAVVLVHGGPWVRGENRSWSAEAQFFATRGYRVLEPDFRGSLGHGAAHFQAGWKQWGRAMQDDLADSVAWATDRKLVDPARVCIVGASYGGYAALMAPIRHPGVFRCAAAHAAVTDIHLMFSSARSDFTRDALRYTMPMLVGDPVADEAMLRAASPLERVAELKVPVLLSHGTLDRRVPREHADRFEAAARKAGVAIERVDYADEAHSWYWASHHADYLRRVELFLARHLKP